jgi:hypothetical protein
MFPNWIRIRDINAIPCVASGIDTHMIKLMKVGSVGHGVHDGSSELLICKLFNKSF